MNVKVHVMQNTFLPDVDSRVKTPLVRVFILSRVGSIINFLIAEGAWFGLIPSLKYFDLFNVVFFLYSKSLS